MLFLPLLLYYAVTYVSRTNLLDNFQSRREFESELIERFGSLVKMPLLKSDRYLHTTLDFDNQYTGNMME